VIARVVVLAAGVLAIAIGLIDRVTEPDAVPFGEFVEPSSRLPTTTLLWVVVLTAAGVAAWRRDVVVLVASVSALVFLWWAHPAPQGYGFVSRQDYEAMRGPLLTSNGIIVGGVLLVAGAVSAIRQRTKKR
jgi:hypothetical protein